MFIPPVLGNICMPSFGHKEATINYKTHWSKEKKYCLLVSSTWCMQVSYCASVLMKEHSSLNMTKHSVRTRPWLLPSPTDINMETPPKQSGDPPFHWDIQPSLSHTPSFLGKSGNALPSRQCSACKWKYWSALLQYLFVLCQAPSYDLYTQCRECRVCRW